MCITHDARNVGLPPGYQKHGSVARDRWYRVAALDKPHVSAAHVASLGGQYLGRLCGNGSGTGSGVLAAEANANSVIHS